MPYEIHVGDDGILRVTFEGDLDLSDITAYTMAYRPFLEGASEAEPLHFLVDVSRLGKASAKARKLFVDEFRAPDPRIGKSAMVGASRYVRVLASFMMKATGREDIRLFTTEKEALAWLEEGA
jgi:hypothetical protein